MIFDVGENNVIRFYDDESRSHVVVLQPNYPNGDSFDTVEEATAWAEALVDFRNSETTPQPPAGKGLARAPRISSDENGNPVVWNAETETWDLIPEPEEETPSA
jgi:hypothetical protein